MDYHDKASHHRKNIKNIECLPVKEAEEVADFAEFILKKHEEYILQKGIYKVTEGSEAFNFLNDEEILYTIKDIKEKY